jgi:PAS domain S-box-containing protein
MLGYGRDEVLARRMQDVTHPNDVQKNLDLIKRSALDGTTYELEKRYVRKDGGIV